MTPFQKHHERLREFVKSKIRFIDGHKLGLLPSRYDPTALRSHLLFMLADPATLPTETFNRLRIPDRANKFNQNPWGDCYDAAFNWGPLAMNAIDQNIWPGGFSEYFGVSVIKNMDGNPDQEGSDIGTTMQSGVQYGCVPDSLMPTSSMPRDYDLPMPSATLITAAAPYRIKNKVQVMSATDTNRAPLITQMMQALAKGFVLEMGAIICQNFMTVTGPLWMVPLPNGSILGGHALRVVDYRIRNGRVEFLIFNTWGNTWGLNGEGWFDQSWFTVQFDMSGEGDMAYYVTEVFQALDVLPAVLPKRTIAMTIGANTALVNGQGVPIPVPISNANGVTVGPIAFIAENLGASVAWDDPTKTATATLQDGTVLQFIAGASYIHVYPVNAHISQVNLPAPLSLVNGHLIGAIRLSAEAMVAQVDWEQSENEVVLTA